MSQINNTEPAFQEIRKGRKRMLKKEYKQPIVECLIIRMPPAPCNQGTCNGR